MRSCSSFLKWYTSALKLFCPVTLWEIRLQVLACSLALLLSCSPGCPGSPVLARSERVCKPDFMPMQSPEGVQIQHTIELAYQFCVWNPSHSCHSDSCPSHSCPSHSCPSHGCSCHRCPSHAHEGHRLRFWSQSRNHETRQQNSTLIKSWIHELKFRYRELAEPRIQDIRSRNH